MKNLKLEQIIGLENKNGGNNLAITDVLFNESRANEIIELLENDELSLTSDVLGYDTITYTDKNIWMDFVYDLKRKIDTINYLTISDNYQYDKFRDIVEDNANTITIHYNDELDLGLLKCELDKFMLFDKTNKNEIKELLVGRVEAYVLPNYDTDVVNNLIEVL